MKILKYSLARIYTGKCVMNVPIISAFVSKKGWNNILITTHNNPDFYSFFLFLCWETLGEKIQNLQGVANKKEGFFKCSGYIKISSVDFRDFTWLLQFWVVALWSHLILLRIRRYIDFVCLYWDDSEWRPHRALLHGGHPFSWCPWPYRKRPSRC